MRLRGRRARNPAAPDFLWASCTKPPCTQPLDSACVAGALFSGKYLAMNLLRRVLDEAEGRFHAHPFLFSV